MRQPDGAEQTGKPAANNGYVAVFFDNPRFIFIKYNKKALKQENLRFCAIKILNFNAQGRVYPVYECL
ncbi:MAG: hypothetical protein ACO1O1_03145 [Adhaeribacter sp.]